MSIESAVRNEVREVAGRAIDGIIGAAEREAARRRVEACIEEEVASRMLATLPRWRWLARAVWRSRHRRHAAYCDAQRKIGDPVAHAVCSAIHRGHA